jgi:hypothetical protein
MNAAHRSGFVKRLLQFRDHDLHHLEHGRVRVPNTTLPSFLVTPD